MHACVCFVSVARMLPMHLWLLACGMPRPHVHNIGLCVKSVVLLQASHASMDLALIPSEPLDGLLDGCSCHVGVTARFPHA
jgi:hypothetical protein